MLSRVVPGSSYTTTRSSPSMRLTRVDLPTLGRPMMAILMPSFSLGPGIRTASSPSATSWSSASSSASRGMWPSTASISALMPRPCEPATGMALPMPSGENSARATSASMLSILFATRMADLFRLRRCSAIIWSAAVMPARASTRNNT
ncbi:hypothetical protein D3C81_1482810 [compost metagenome]